MASYSTKVASRPVLASMSVHSCARASRTSASLCSRIRHVREAARAASRTSLYLPACTCSEAYWQSSGLNSIVSLADWDTVAIA